MKRYIFILGICLLYCTEIMSQTIDIDLPFHANRNMILTLRYGKGNDTIYNGLLDDKGKISITLPDENKGYRGMATLITGRRNASLNFIIAGEDFSISSKAEFPYGDLVTFTNSLENSSYTKWFRELSVQQQKIAALSAPLSTYAPDDAFYPLLERELKLQKRQEQQVSQTLRDSKLYAARYLLLNIEGSRIVELASIPEYALSVREYVRDTLDINALYTSGLWFDILNGILPVYDENSPYHKDFVNDMIVLLEKAEQERTYPAFGADLLEICDAKKWGEQGQQLAAYLLNGKYINQPKRKLKQLTDLFKFQIGEMVPDLTQGKLPAKNTILMFYESGCNNCDRELTKLTEMYPQLVQKGYDIVSVSADSDKKIFNSKSASLPWNNKFCDFKGFAGKDFINYGIMGTPTFYLLDAQHVVVGRYARVEDMKILK